ncbi:MAG: hypothetical protein HC892_11915 [Saprospiraceae bacterium]|nr:hypothetical protein [Saprospiraceae bacterium]
MPTKHKLVGNILPDSMPELSNLTSSSFQIFEGIKVPNQVAERILTFLNQAQDAKTITNYELQNNPNSSEQGYAIGETVAIRILEKRNTLLPFQQFRQLAELEDISGLGKDKMMDLIYTFSIPADEVFRSTMYRDVIGENWELNFNRTAFEQSSQFLEIATHPALLLETISQQVNQISIKKFDNSALANFASYPLRQAYIETFSDEYAAVAFAFWLYRVDADNWFSLPRVLTYTRNYFNPNSTWDNRLELQLFKGYPNNGLLTQSVTNIDLPVVINYAEQSITVWTVQLND